MTHEPSLFDPENVETQALLNMTGPLSGMRILEIGCGDGRLTQRYAAHAAEVIAIDPDAERIAAAIQGAPSKIKEKVRFEVADLFSYKDSKSFDLAILAWSL